MQKKTLFIFSTLFILILAFLCFKAWNNYFDLKRKILELEKRKIAWKILERQIKEEASLFPGEAGIFIEDLNQRWQIGISQDKIFPAASLVKIPIMAACFYAVNEGKIKLDEVLILKAQDRSGGSGKLKDSPVGTELSIRDLIELMIAESDNTAANILIERLGMAYLNDCFKNLRLKNTNMSREMMDFRSRRQGKENFTTASDVSLLLEKIYHGRLVNKSYSGMCLEYLKKQKIRDRIPKKLPPETGIAHKTGLERGICHDAGIVFTNAGDFLICVLTKHRQKTARSAKDFIAQLALKTYNYYRAF